MRTIARIYSHAVFNLSVEQNTIEQWETYLTLFSAVSQNQLMQSLFLKILDAKKLSNIFLTISEEYYNKTINIFSKNLIHIMAENNRLSLIPIVLEEFKTLKSIYTRIIQIEVTSAWKLTNRQIKKITNIFTHTLSQTVNVINQVNQNILGGIIIRIEDNIIDNSIRGQISRLKKTLLQP